MAGGDLIRCLVEIGRDSGEAFERGPDAEQTSRQLQSRMCVLGIKAALKVDVGWARLCSDK